MSVAELSPSPYPISLVIPEESREPLLLHPAGHPGTYTNRHTNVLFDDEENQTLGEGASRNDTSRRPRTNNNTHEMREGQHEENARQERREGRDTEADVIAKKVSRDVGHAILRITLIPLILWLAWNKLLLIRLASACAHVLTVLADPTARQSEQSMPNNDDDPVGTGPSSVDGIKHLITDSFSLSYPVAVFIVFLIDLIFVH